MKVTAIEELSKSRSKIYIDGEFAFVLYKGELRLYRIKQGEEISDSVYTEILGTVLSKRAKLRAMNLLKSREYTEKQLYNKLKEGFYPENVIEEALAYVASYHYTDDLRYAVSYIEAHEESRSRRRIEQDLMGKGISKTTLAQAFAQWEDQGGSQNEGKMIRELLAKRRFDPENADAKEFQKTYAFLMRKGFSAESIRKEMKNCSFFDYN